MLGNSLTLGPFKLDLKRKLLFLGSEQIAVGQRGFDILRALVLANGWPVSKAELMDAAWPGMAVEESNLNVQIATLRKALAGATGVDEWIITVPRYGYQLAELPAHFLAASGLSEPVLKTTKPAIAVLPFQNLGTSEPESYFAQGITEDVTTELSRIREFIVICENTMRAFQGREVKLREVGSSLGIDYFLSGSVRVEGDIIRVTAQLAESNSGTVLWRDRFDRQAADVFAIQDEIARSVIAEIGSEVLAAEFDKATRKQPESLTAWECFIRAVVLSSRQSNTDSEMALALLEKANGIEADYARALGLQAWVLLWRCVQGWQERVSALARGADLVRRAMAADDQEPWSWVGQGMLHLVSRQFEEAIKAFEIAVRLRPNFVLAWGMLGLAQAFNGQPAVALVTLEQVNRLSPREMFVGAIAQQLAFAHFLLGDYVNALEHARHAHMLRPGHVYPLVIAGASAGHLGRLDLGRSLIRDLQQLAPSFTIQRMQTETPFACVEDRNRLVEGLMAAGLD